MADRFIGQHHDDHAPAINNGQRNWRSPGVSIGNESGGESRNRARHVGTSSDVSTAIDVVTGNPIHRGRPGATERKE